MIRRGEPVREAIQESKSLVPAAPAPQTLAAMVEALERCMIEDALRACHGNKQKAAQLLGLSRQGLIEKLRGRGVRR